MCFCLGKCCILTILSLRYFDGGYLLINSICFLNFQLNDNMVAKVKKKAINSSSLFCLVVLCTSRVFLYICKQIWAYILIVSPFKQSIAYCIIILHPSFLTYLSSFFHISTLKVSSFFLFYSYIIFHCMNMPYLFNHSSAVCYYK